VVTDTEGLEGKTAHSGVSRTTSTNPELRTQRENSRPQGTRTHAGSRRITFSKVRGTDDPRQLMKEWWHPLGVWEATDREGNTCHSLQCEGRVPICPVSFSHLPRVLRIKPREFRRGTDLNTKTESDRRDPWVRAPTLSGTCSDPKTSGFHTLEAMECRTCWHSKARMFDLHAVGGVSTRAS